MKRAKAQRYEPPVDLAVIAEQAGGFFRRTGSLPACWNTQRVTGAMIARGLASHAELKAAGLNVPPLQRGGAEWPKGATA